MTKLLIDAGTSWCKVLELYKDHDDLDSSSLNKVHDIISEYKFERTDLKNARSFLFPTKLLSKLKILFDGATGHMVKNHIKPDGNYENEVIALAYGAKKLLNNPDNAIIVDLGSRDIKWVQFKNGKYKDLDWNTNCGSATGATVEMLCKFYNVDPETIEIQKEKIPVVCGVFAMEKIMDAIANDIPAEVAIAKYIHGIAYNTWNFARQPEKIYLSGGFCMNSCFVKSLELYCEVITLGRFVLLEGLY
jgi:activator of 2-hydroxyglutaryl-CoA dehydratase